MLQAQGHGMPCPYDQPAGSKRKFRSKRLTSGASFLCPLCRTPSFYATYRSSLWQVECTVTLVAFTHNKSEIGVNGHSLAGRRVPALFQKKKEGGSTPSGIRNEPAEAS